MLISAPLEGREKNEEKKLWMKKIITLVNVFWEVALYWNEEGDLRTWMLQISWASHKRTSDWKCTSESLVFLWERPTAQQVNYSLQIVNDCFCLQKAIEKYWLRYCKSLRKGHFSGMSGIQKGHTAWESRSEEGELFTTGAKRQSQTEACMGDATEQRK